MPTVIYKGKAPLTVDKVRFDPGAPVEVDEKLAEEIRAGEGRLSGYKFEVQGDEPEPKSKTSRTRKK